MGLDDVVSRTPASDAAKARALAAREMQDIERAYRSFRLGRKGPWLVSASKVSDRLDAKFLRPWSVSKLLPYWKDLAEAVPLRELVEPVEKEVELRANERYQFLRITYEGRGERGDSRLGKEVTYERVCTALVGDIVVSNINAVNRAVCVLSEGCEDLLISPEFTILRLKRDAPADPFYLWSILRTDGVVAEWLSSSSGVGRHRVRWETLQEQLVPLLPLSQQAEVGDKYRDIQEREAAIESLVREAAAVLEPLQLQGGEASERLTSAKPPK